MTAPISHERPAGASSPMTPERWRAVDAILRGALTFEPEHRATFIAEACAGDEAMRREVESLLAAHDVEGDGFLERPAAEALPAASTTPLTERLAKALAGQYEIAGEIARGGMATVILARDLRHNRQVAIKVLREEIAAAVGADRFLEEIRVTASLQHPHILPLFESGSADGLLWFVMPFVAGETLRARMTREGRLPVDVTLQLAREMADALEHAHSRGVVHRDVKPENVLMQDGHALVADFGIALALEHAGGDRLTRTGITLGTPQYMAPEQARGERAIDARTDVYALGAVMYEMLAGESPFAAASNQAVMRRVLHVSPVPLPTRRAEVPPSVDAVVRRALSKRPEDRFPSAAALSAALAEPPPVARLTGVMASAAKPRANDERTDVAAGRARLLRLTPRAALIAAVVIFVIGAALGWALARSPLLGSGWADNGAPGAPPPRADGAGTWAPPKADGAGIGIVDRGGRELQAIPANRGWTPRFSPDGKYLAYGAYGGSRNSSDVWVADLATGMTRRLTDDDGDSNDPQWSPDGATIAYSVNAPDGKDVLARRLDGGQSRTVLARQHMQFGSDWKRDGTAMLVTQQGPKGLDVLVQPADGSGPLEYAASGANESAARFSPDGRWVAYTSDESGRAEVYIDSYPTRGRRVRVSWDGGLHPAWRGDGRELYYWNDGALVAVALGAPNGNAAPAVGAQSVLFRSSYIVAMNTMYDVSADGQRFALAR